MTQSQKLHDLNQVSTRAKIAKESGIRERDLNNLYYYDEQLSEKDSAKLDRLHELEFGGEE